MLNSNTNFSVSKVDFLKKVEVNGIPPLAAEIPYIQPDILYPVFSGANSFLLESVKGPENIARYSFIGFDPYLTFKVKDGAVEITAKGKKAVSSVPPLARLKSLVDAYRQTPLKSLPPFQGGAVGLLSYDFVRYLEKLPKAARDDLQIPDAHFLMIDKLIAFDHLDKKAWIVVCPGARDTELGYGDVDVDWAEKYDEAEETIKNIRYRIQDTRYKIQDKKNHASSVRHEMSKEQYMDIVKRAKEYIAAGDIFQANISLRVSADIGDIKPWSLYKILRSINPSPFAGYIDFGDYQIVSSSPERLLKVKDGVIETRPIAGTRPRGRDMKEDELMRAELLLNEKERAEHIMLIDLERNDIGRVSDYGSVHVDELMITEDYSHVIHIVSNVKGNLASGKTCFDAIRATFPGGTITGVPKVRCMEIIDELEPVSRGPYTGSFGYIGFSGSMDLNIIIRTFVIKDGFAYVQAGAGIVADSDPEKEYYESLKKAEALIRTLERL
ncbi:MAG: anthranilate synthase component I family protein [Thermodesulfovibrionales bacterium]|nr:anthranilate synthase component I family protein [Thermodesulfovibrionales bacterium]